MKNSSYLCHYTEAWYEWLRDETRVVAGTYEAATRVQERPFKCEVGWQLGARAPGESGQSLSSLAYRQECVGSRQIARGWFPTLLPLLLDRVLVQWGVCPG